MLIRCLFLLWLATSLTSCKTDFSVRKYPPKPEGVFISGKCLVNEIQTDFPLKHQQKVVEKMMSGLRQVIPQVYYAGYYEDMKQFALPLNVTAHPELLTKINNELGFDYLIDFQATSTNPRTGWGIALVLQNFDHQVNVSISVYDTRSQKLLYYQRIEVKEEWEESNEYYYEDYEDSQGGFLQDGLVIPRTSENLLKIGIKKCTYQLKRNALRKIKSDYPS